MALYVSMPSSLQVGGKGKRSRMRSLNRKKGQYPSSPAELQHKEVSPQKCSKV